MTQIIATPAAGPLTFTIAVKKASENREISKQQNGMLFHRGVLLTRFVIRYELFAILDG
jgi:hypothetical protein